ncbi:unnamed protein product [Ceutorhynchus assimilis]|uniref:Transcription factor IIIC 90kDa subunit N-terminal domain-containing protein n=1 Tax=Ceutorhynchus assimilis TaxID=467358 RepID=A0A9N9QLK9_9CUCU|nr:unnamed protein product [Ceutorhynchus assimilis]
MSPNLKPLTAFVLTGNLQRNFACGISQDDRIFILSSLGVYVIEQKCNLKHPDPDYSSHKFFFKPSDFALCGHVDIDINTFVHELPKDVFYENCARVELTQNLKGAVPPTPPTVLYAQWSKALMVDGLSSMLAIVTNLHSLEIYVKMVNECNLSEYKMILNLTSEIVEKQRPNFGYIAKLPPIQKMNEVRKRVEYIGPCTFEWSHTFSYTEKNCAVIFVGHYNGDVSVWRIFSCDSRELKTQCDFLCRYTTKLRHISCLYWHKTSEFGGALCLGDCEGRISIIKVINLDKDEASLDHETPFFTEMDRRVDKIIVMTIDSYTVLVAIKQCFLLLFGLNSAGQVFDFTTHNVNNLYITGVTCENNIMRVLTFTGGFKELKVSIHYNKISIDELNIPVKFNFCNYRTHGFIESKNKVLTAFILSPCRLKNSIKGKKFINCSFFKDLNINPLKVLLENESGSLRNYWDCFEALRLMCVKEQRVPWLGLDSDLELDNLSLLQLKTFRLIAQLSESVFVVVKRVTSYNIKPFIFYQYLVTIKLIIQRLSQLFKEKSQGKQLTTFELRSLDLQVFFLKEIISNGVLPKAQVGATFIEEISNILQVANELKYPDMIQCSYCGEKLIGSMCLPPHPDGRCVFTMMPIFLAPAYKCPLCNSLAHIKAIENLSYILCAYCDFPMDRICLNKQIEEKMEEMENVFTENQIKSKCLSDCISDSEETQDSLYFNLEDNETVFVNLSDTEEEAEENELRDLYFKLPNTKSEAYQNVGAENGKSKC